MKIRQQARCTKSIVNNASPIKQRGVSLIELMISIVLGMLAILAVLSAYMAIARTHATGDNLARIQDNTRMAFEFMTSDFRDAGLVLCGDVATFTNELAQNPHAPAPPEFWWGARGIRGYASTATVEGRPFGVQPGNRAAGTEAVQVSASRGNGISVISVATSAPGEFTFTLQNANHGFGANEAVIVCDQNQAHLTRISPIPLPPAAPTNRVSTNLPANTAYQRNSIMAAYSTTLWYIGCTGRGNCAGPGGRALFRIASGENNTNAEEIVPDVSEMRLFYLVRGSQDYVSAAAIAANDWGNVIAMRISLTLHSTDRNVATDTAQEGRLFRTVTHTIALRNRVP